MLQLMIWDRGSSDCQMVVFWLSCCPTAAMSPFVLAVFHSVFFLSRVPPLTPNRSLFLPEHSSADGVFLLKGRFSVPLTPSVCSLGSDLIVGFSPLTDSIKHIEVTVFGIWHYLSHLELNYLLSYFCFKSTRF